jgi:glutathione S-transferase
MVKVYGHPFSTCTRKVLTTLIENSIPYELEMVDLTKGEHKAAANMARQPFGQVPAIDDDGFKLYESRAICRYLDEKGGHKLSPRDARAKALMEQWISIETSNFTPHAMKFVYHHLFHMEQEPKVLEAAGVKVAEALAVMDAHLAKHPYFAGEQFTLADVGFMPYFQAVAMTPAKDLLTKWPNVMTWWTRASERPSWRTVTA